MGLREDILGSDDLAKREVAVPEWKCGKVTLRELSGTDRDDWETSLVRLDENGKRVVSRENARANLVARSIVDAEGNRVFSDADIEKLGRKSGKVLDRLYDVAVELSGIGPKAIEAAAKN